MDIIDMPDDVFAKFMQAEQLDRVKIVCELLGRKRDDDVKEIAWIPLYGQKKLVEVL